MGGASWRSPWLGLNVFGNAPARGDAGSPGKGPALSSPRTKEHGRWLIFAPLTGVSFNFKDGKLENFKAEKGAECFEQTMAPYPESKYLLGSFQIGLNPEAKVMEDPGDYRPANAAGLVWINTGDNLLLGGNNHTQSGGYGFPIAKATVEADGKVVVKDGQLVPMR